MAEAAAWEAYSRARAIRPALRGLGLDLRHLPREGADEAAARGRALLAAVMGGWTEAESRAVDGARLRGPLI